jgi:hypothetical protein
MSRADRLVIALLALAAIAAWPLVSAASPGAGAEAFISGPQGETTVPLSVDGDYEIVGSRGTLKVRVADGGISVTESGCPDRTCVHTGVVSSAGSVVACVPNGVVVRVGGARSGGLDASVR